MCGRCLGGLDDPLDLLPRMQDATADLRLFRRGSLLLRIGPVVGEDVEVGRGVEPALRLRSLLEEGDPEGLARFVDKYLAGAGIGLHLWGDERIPRRSLVWNVVKASDSANTQGVGWDRACIRVANVHSLVVSNASALPVDREWLAAFMASHTRAAEKCYSRASDAKELAATSSSNLALLKFYNGKGDEALRMLEGLEDSSEIIVKKAIVLDGLGRREEALSALQRIPQERMDRRTTALRLRLEGVQ
jgi:tetratricopeptide (TPR) repeat protein